MKSFEGSCQNGATAPHARYEPSDHASFRSWDVTDENRKKRLLWLSRKIRLDKGSTAIVAGCGSGTDAYHLARVNPKVRMFGIDNDPTAIEACRARYKRKNLSFETGDITQVFPEKVDMIISNFTLHHIFAFQFPAYSIANVERVICHYAASLNDNGRLIVNDFVIPDLADRSVVLSLKDEGKRTGPFAERDEPSLLEHFAAHARPLSKNPGFPLQELTARDGMRRFSLSLGDATEFLMRKDYREDWEAELQEQYGYFTIDGCKAAFAKAGFGRTLPVSVHKHWIYENRWKDRIRLENENGIDLMYPPTDMLVVGRKFVSTS